MPRKVNEELRKMVLHLYLTGYTPRMIADAVAETTGRRYSVSYIRWILHVLRREGVLSKPAASPAWEELLTHLRAAKLRVAAALDEARLSTRSQRLAGDLEAAAVHLEKALATYILLRRTFEGVRLAR